MSGDRGGAADGSNAYAIRMEALGRYWPPLQPMIMRALPADSKALEDLLAIGLTADGGLPTVLVNHWPLTREPTAILRYPEFAQWCGTQATADWHLRFRTAAVVYGHLHIPCTTWHDGVPFREVSLGYPREWQRRAGPPYEPRQVLP